MRQRKRGAATYPDLLGGSADWGGAGGARQGWEEKGTETKARAEAYRPSPGPTRALVPVERDGGGAPDCCHSVASAARRLM